MPTDPLIAIVPVSLRPTDTHPGQRLRLGRWGWGPAPSAAPLTALATLAAVAPATVMI
ncbi:hypothetical protein SIM91_00400 [Rhodococcus opacus]|uniref:hypothetical protein n=1 Tax=Rhodococcus opacus TaxID=37919 RepID=UPI0029C5DFD0|nr:hypothetical protein [Rhodococcus opacus]MDX5961829.1 hypothetical protein [Rhodococcus opacus]